MIPFGPFWSEYMFVVDIFIKVLWGYPLIPLLVFCLDVGNINIPQVTPMVSGDERLSTLEIF